MTNPITPPTTDLAARFEAKREECWKLAAIGEGRNGVDFWAGGASAFAEARDMARAGAAGGADGFVLVPREPTPKMVASTWNDHVDANGGIESQNARNKRIYRAMIAAAAPAAPPPPAQQVDKQRRDEDGFVCEYDQGCKPETDTYTICWDGGARWLIVDRHGLITIGQSPADDRPVQQTTWQALMSPPPAQQGSSPPPLTAERVDLPPPLTSLKAMVRERLSEIKETTSSDADR